MQNIPPFPALPQRRAGAKVDYLFGQRVGPWPRGTGVPPVTIRQHGRDGRALWTNRAKPRFYGVFNGMDTAELFFAVFWRFDRAAVEPGLICSKI